MTPDAASRDPIAPILDGDVAIEDAAVVDRISAAERHALTADQFLIPEREALPVDTKGRWRAARGRIFNEHGLSDEERERLVAKWKRIGRAKGWLSAQDALNDAAIDDGRELLMDVTDATLEVIEDAAGKPLKLRIRLSKANVRNLNERIYPRAIVADAVREAQARLRSNPHAKPTMQWTHPPAKFDQQGNVIGWAEDPGKYIAVIDAIYLAGDGRLMIDTTFLDTEYGRSIAAKYRAGARTPVSLRATGHLRYALVDGRRTGIATSLTIHGGDFLDNPAMLDAGPEYELTDEVINDALSVEEERHMNELEQLKAQVKHLLDAQTAPKDGKIEALEKKITDLEMERDKMKIAADKGEKGKREEDEKKEDEVKDAATAKAIADLQGKVNAYEQAIADQAAAAKAATEKVKVGAIVDAVKASADYARFTAPMREMIATRVAKATTEGEAQQALADAMESFDAAIASAKLAASGFGPNAHAPAGNVAGALPTPGLEITSNPTPWMAVADKYDAACRDYERRSVGPRPDPSLRKQNKGFIDQMMKEIPQIVMGDGRLYGEALTDSANALVRNEPGNRIVISDSAKGPIAIPLTDATGTTQLWNQPTITIALLMQQFFAMEALGFVGGIGPQGFEQRQFNGKIGSVLKVPVEVRQLAAGSQNLPYWSDGLLSPEGMGINELKLQINWLDFIPNWRRIGFTLTADAEKALMNGPLNYAAWARHAYHVSLLKAQAIDLAIYEEMLLASAEVDAVRITNEVPSLNEWVYSAGGNVAFSGGVYPIAPFALQYGANVVAILQLRNGGASPVVAKKVLIPTVRPRPVQNDLTTQGQPVATTPVNAIVLSAINGTPQFMGYLDGNQQIQPFYINGVAQPCTFAVDWLNGVLCFNAASGADATHLPTSVSYSYETNYDQFQLYGVTLGSGITPQEFYSNLLAQMDLTASFMGSYPRVMPPDFTIMSLASAVPIQNAQTFWKLVSPEGSRLKDPKLTSNMQFAVRDNIELAKINAPWSAQDARMLFGRLGGSKYGIDTPAELQGPYPDYMTTGGAGSPVMMLDNKKAYLRENSVICSPQVTDQSGKVINPLYRTLIIRSFAIQSP